VLCAGIKLGETDHGETSQLVIITNSLLTFVKKPTCACCQKSGIFSLYPIFPSITRALSTQKYSVNGKKNDDARYAMKI
jgi:hypothetical protein